MAYKRIPTAHIGDPKSKEILDRSNDLLADAYSMCSTAWLKRLNAGHCNLSIALVLTCVIDALAARLYSATKGQGTQQWRFETLVMDKLHWRASSVPKAAGARVLYVECRNPLVHAVGIEPDDLSHRPPGLIDTTVGPWGKVKERPMRVIDAMPTWPDAWPVVEVLTDKTGTRYKVTAVALYWVVKDLVRQFAK
jgi:hypothetical protein